jgi:pimeloyl-ACP methyl ester carboxylesterase
VRNQIAGALAAALFCMTPLAAHAAALPPDPPRAESFDVGMLHVDRYGSGDPIVLLPGLACGAWTWNGLIPNLAAKHSVYAVTIAGFAGRPPAGEASFAAFDKDLTTLLDQRHIVKPVLVGHSLGGTLAIAYAETHADRLRAVVAADGLPVLPGTQQLTQQQREAAGAQMGASVKGQTHEQLLAFEKGYMARVGVNDAALADQLAALAAQSDPATVAAWLQADVAADLPPNLPKITVPVLEIAPHSPAEADAALPIHYTEAEKADYYRSLLAGVPTLDVVTIAPARHFVMLDQPERFQKARLGVVVDGADGHHVVYVDLDGVRDPLAAHRVQRDQARGEGARKPRLDRTVAVFIGRQPVAVAQEDVKSLHPHLAPRATRSRPRVPRAAADRASTARAFRTERARTRCPSRARRSRSARRGLADRVRRSPYTKTCGPAGRGSTEEMQRCARTKAAPPWQMNRIV